MQNSPNNENLVAKRQGFFVYKSGRDLESHSD